MMQSKSTIDNHREISAALDFLRQASTDDGAFELDPRVVSGWVEMCLGALEVLVTAKRGKHADDKALKQTVEEHLDHAQDHINEALDSSISDSSSGGYGLSGLDDDQLPHHDHATARIALLYARKAIVEREKEDSPLIKFMVLPVDNDVITVTNRKQAEELFGVGSGLVDTFKPAPKTYPNSCKVDKLEHGYPSYGNDTLGYNWFYRDSRGYTLSTNPTRPIETDNKPGKVSARCAAPKSTPVSAWILYVDDVKVTEVTDVKREYGSGIPGMDKMPGFVSETTFGTKPIGIAMNSARQGELVSIAISGSGTVTLCDKCHGCSYVKWPNKGPGYSERCNKCKLDPNRPGYAGK